MNDIRTSLVEDDPVATQPALPQSDVEAMRRRVLTLHPTPAPPRWTWTLTLAAALVTIVVAGVGVVRRAEPGGIAAVVSLDDIAARGSNDDRRQLQFATPGGTRVIWVFNADFETR